MDINTKLAKMNMAVHGLDGDIVQGNSFYDDKHELLGKCDFVMANPPFNVDGVDKSKDSVKNDPRLPFGLPKNDNANYLWIQYFYSYLNEKSTCHLSPHFRRSFYRMDSSPFNALR